VGQDDPPAPEEVKIGGDPRKRYLLHGGGKDSKAVASGWKVLVVMPGGDGSAEFAPFVGRIRENVLGKDWLVVQIVAPVWSGEQAEKLVWPTKLNPWPKIEFTCEELFAEVLADVGKSRKLGPRADRWRTRSRSRRRLRSRGPSSRCRCSSRRTCRT
jgi:hypothetical protein